jgi:hypothetical protein
VDHGSLPNWQRPHPSGAAPAALMKALGQRYVQYVNHTCRISVVD